MFHRVKAETEKSRQSEQKPVVSAPVAVPQRPVSEVLSASPVKQQVAPQMTVSTVPTVSTVSTPKPEQAAAEKEAPTMNKDNSQTEIEETAAESKALDIPSSSYAAGPVRGSSYAAYAGYGAQSPSAANAQASSSKGGLERKLVIGQGITMSGEIESCDHLIVEGTIEAALKGASVLDISETGTFYGTVDIEQATVAGRFEGELTVNGRLTVRSSGSITGTISYKELEIEAGAIVDGKLVPLKAGGEAHGKKPEKMKSPKEAAALAKARELKAQSGDQHAPANNDEGGLFSEATAAE